MNAITEPNPTELHGTMKLQINAFAKWFDVARQLEGDSDEASWTQAAVPDS